MAQDSEARSALVSVSDLDLASVKGQRDAQRHIRAAVSSVCPDVNVRDLHLRNKTMQCRAQALAMAAVQMDQKSKAQRVAAILLPIVSVKN